MSDSLTKEELDLLMEKFVKDVATNRYAEEGWPKSVKKEKREKDYQYVLEV